jgi:hypothetical protein
VSHLLIPMMPNTRKMPRPLTALFCLIRYARHFVFFAKS